MLTKKVSDIFQQVAGQSRSPKYQQVCDTLISMIDTGNLKPGDKIPTETWLTNALPVSLGTVQKALNMLTSRGILNRQQGSGTFVADRQIRLDELWHFRFIDDTSKTILPLTTNVLGIERSTEKGPWVEFLGKENFYIRITRRILVDNQFNCISRFYLSGEQFSDLLSFEVKDLEDTLLRDIISQRFGRPTEQIRERVAATSFPDEVNHQLKLPPNSTGLVCHIMAYSQHDRPLSFQQLYVPPGMPMMETREVKPG